MLRRSGSTGNDGGLPMSMSDVEGARSPMAAPFFPSGAINGVKGNSGGLMRLVLPQHVVKKAAATIAVVGFLLALVAGDKAYLITAVTICLCGLLFGNHLSGYVLSADDGDEEMRRVSNPIREGAEGFLKVQYGTIRRFAAVVAGAIFLSYQFREYSPNGHGVGSVNPWIMGFVGASSFLLGCACSAFAGYVSMWVSARANIRVASAARRSHIEALLLCFRGGAFSAVLVISMCVLGVSFLHTLLHMLFVGDPSVPGSISPAEVPLLLAGYGFGASFVALFMQLGGGVYTKAADVGADLVGKVERSIPEDDPRNPAVIADLVGDMVGDCVGSSADIFESVAAEIIGAMILGGVLAQEAGLESATPFVFFPVVIHAFDVLVSSVAILSVGRGPEADPMAMLMRGYLVSLLLAAVGFVFATWWLLSSDKYPGAWLHYLACGAVGMCTAYVFIRSSQYYTDYAYEPVQSIAKASTTGHGTNIITGVAVGMKSTFIPVIAVSVAVVTSYHLGRTSGMGSGHNAGLFGTAVATMGMLSSAAFVLSMNNYGPIADNAGGIVEMSHQDAAVREATDRLDAAGNVTKAMTKGYSIGSAALACFLMFGALLDEFTEFAGQPFRTVDIATPEVLVGGMLGVMMVFYFVGLSVAAVGTTAGKVVEEVRRQFDAYPEILAGTRLPDYRACVSLVTKAALKEMRLPGMLAVGMPVAVGIVFRVVGAWTDRPLLGAEVLCAFLMMSTVTGILMALFLDNVGGAWDNAKKFIELGNYGGKNSEAHKASVTGDTVGDPFKDTAGPALHVVIKLLSTTILVLGPAFVAHQQANAAELAASG